MNNVNYQIRSIQLLNYLYDLRKKRIIPDPFFQRNLVWRDIHKKDFIQTILLGYPFPQIFITKGKIDISLGMSISSIVDGQQRTNAILEYIDNQISVDGAYFQDLSEEEKEKFYKYEVAVIELDLTNDDPKVQEIFQRINRAANSLTTIEKKSSEFGTSEFMIFCEYITGHLSFEEEDFLDEDYEQDEDEEVVATNQKIYEIKSNPFVTDDFKKWAKCLSTKNYTRLLNNNNIFTRTQIAKKTNLMYTLNLVSTYLNGFYNRNTKAWEDSQLYLNIDIDRFDEVMKIFERVSTTINHLKFNRQSIWLKKANFFTIFIFLANNCRLLDDITFLKEAIENFTPDAEYKLAAKEGVNNLKERELRNYKLEQYFQSL